MLHLDSTGSLQIRLLLGFYGEIVVLTPGIATLLLGYWGYNDTIGIIWRLWFSQLLSLSGFRGANKSDLPTL